MNKVFLKLSLLFLLPISCNFSGNQVGVLSSRVTVIPAPYGIGDSIRPSQPTIFLSRGKFTCRHRPVNPKIMIDLLGETISEEGLINIFGITEDEIDFLKKDVVLSQSRLNDLRPVTIDVGEEGAGWLKLGLFISNGNTGTYPNGAPRNFSLIVTSVSFTAVAQYRGQSYQASNDIQAGYCRGSESASAAFSNPEGGETSQQSVDIGGSFLYIVPPGTKVEYNPTSQNPFHNLTLYLSGFPIIDNSKELSPDQQTRINNLNSRGGGSNQGGESNSTFRQGDPLRVIPRYTVDLTLRGHFVTTEGDLVSDFTKRVRFFTQSSTDF